MYSPPFDETGTGPLNPKLRGLKKWTMKCKPKSTNFGEAARSTSGSKLPEICRKTTTEMTMSHDEDLDANRKPDDDKLEDNDDRVENYRGSPSSDQTILDSCLACTIQAEMVAAQIERDRHPASLKQATCTF